MTIYNTSSEQDREIRTLLSERLNLQQDYTWLFEYIRDNFVPDDIFTEKVLCAWAEDFGYKLPDE